MRSAEIIAVGSELLTPEKTDTNGLWLTERLNEAGIEVMQKTIVGDDALRLRETIQDAFKRSDIVIATGGLGPTEDDITRQISAAAVGRELLFRPELEAELRNRFERMGRAMPEINRRQAYVIDGAEVLPNPNGSAVGMYLESDGKLLIVMPGPPREMKPMFDDHVAHRLAGSAGGVIVRRRIIRVSGMGESAVDEAVAPIYRGYPAVRTAILFNRTEVEVHIYAKASTASEADQVLEELAAKMKDKLGEAVFTTTGETMEEVIGQMLRDRGATLSTAESCTGGLVGRRITEVAGSSDYFIEGAITYSNEAKIRTLNVPRETLEDHGAVSAETASAMAEGMRRRALTTYAVSVTGIAGPGGGTEEKPVGTVFIGFSSEKTTRAIKLLLPGDRYLIRWRSSQATLDYLRRQMLKRG